MAYSSKAARPVVAAAAVSMLAVSLQAGAVTAAPAAPPSSASALTAPAAPVLADGGSLTNTAHLDFLMETVPLTPVPGHTTYKLDEIPSAQAPWTYADKKADGSYGRVGGGNLDPATGHWTQGAYNADDIARTAVVYLRHWQQTGDAASRERAFQTLRSLTYLQTTDGPNAGNVVLWQQEDGSLTPSAKPVELPDPSDSAESYWLARTVWALGEGFTAFQDEDPEFAGFLQDRLRLALGSLNRQSLAKYGTYDTADGVQVPAWLIAGGADASAEAVLGLSSYVTSVPDDELAATALDRLSEGVAAMSSGTTGQWPFGAIMPWNKSQTLWHAWGGMAPAAVATASEVLDRPALLEAAVKDTAQFTPQLLAAGGPDNAWSPAPGEAQIAYGVDSRVQSLVATARAADAPGLRDLAAITAGWFFGANPSGAPAYNPATGTAIDGIEPDGRVNPNSGAESTIHALLTMLALDEDPALKTAALGISRTVSTHGLSVVEAESGTVTGPGSVVKPASAWTGEANLSGGAYVDLKAGASLDIPVPASDQPHNIYPIVNRGTAPAGTTAWTSAKGPLGTTENGGAGEQGITDAPGILFPYSLKRALSAGLAAVVGTTDGNVALDALLLQPQISTVSVSGAGGDSTLYVSAAGSTTVESVAVPDGFTMVQRQYDSSGQPVAGGKNDAGARSGQVAVAPGGFTMVTFLAR
ncbi:hypothetical protein [Arthrobacter sp. B10-11]|uniref:hypothetical protein n=1 Tax=Arthrobacter sp. B10-11 TaxID=3081160 RepID=UPI002954BEE0|nr:hypothetical protein [Arthrobacter sp. B10-11]MDV8148659.1 hypothetical protein [Arthrobacter sp. B10-11]